MKRELLVKAFNEKKMVYFDCYFETSTDENELDEVIGQFDPNDYPDADTFCNELGSYFYWLEKEVEKVQDRNSYDTVED